MAYFKINMHPTELPKLGPVKVELPDGNIVEGRFESVGQNNQGDAVVIRYAIPGRILIPQPQRSVTEEEFKKWLSNRAYVFTISTPPDGKK